MATTYQFISSVTVGSGGASSMDFTSIPQTYTDLLLFVTARNTGNGSGLYLRFNGGNSNYSTKELEGNGASAYSSNNTAGTSYGFCGSISNSSTTASTFANNFIYIPNYAGSNNKSFSADGVGENNATTVYADLIAGLWSNTAAITQVTLYPSLNSFAQYSTAYLYGIKNS